jgi:hypothetical protein
MPIPTQSEHSEDSLPANLFARRPSDLEIHRYPNERSSVGKRPFISILIIFCIDVSATLAWQWYGAGEIIASSSPQLSGLPPQAEPVPQNAPEVIGQGRTDRMVTTQDQIARNLDRMATAQEQIMRSVDQLRADQEQMAREITKLQETAQSIRSKNSEPRPASASALKPVLRPASASAAKPISPTPTLPEPTVR